MCYADLQDSRWSMACHYLRSQGSICHTASWILVLTIFAQGLMVWEISESVIATPLKAKKSTFYKVYHQTMKTYFTWWEFFRHSLQEFLYWKNNSFLQLNLDLYLASVLSRVSLLLFLFRGHYIFTFWLRLLFIGVNLSFKAKHYPLIYPALTNNRKTSGVGILFYRNTSFSITHSFFWPYGFPHPTWPLKIASHHSHVQYIWPQLLSDNFSYTCG